MYRKKREAFTGVHRYGQKAKETPHLDTVIADPAPSSSCDQSSPDGECDQTISASKLKMRREDASDSSSESSDGENSSQERDTGLLT